jgi:hypothetical protein
VKDNKMPYSKKAKYNHNRQITPDKFQKHKTKEGKMVKFQTVPLDHTEYSGKKFDKPGAKAIVGVLKPKFRKKGKSGKPKRFAIQSILMPK